MKHTFITIFGILASLQLCFADAKTEFIESIRQAHESGSVSTFLDLHYGGIPEDLRPMFERRWNHEIKKGKLTDLSIRPFEREDALKFNGEMSIKGDLYTRTAPATAFVVFTYKKESASVPIVMAEGSYYIASIKKKEVYPVDGGQ